MTDVARLTALRQLLAAPDTRDLIGVLSKPRGHRQLHRGARDRFERLWRPAAHAWITRRLGALDYWRPAMTPTLMHRAYEIRPSIGVHFHQRPQ
jgi:hypothetical protein